MFLDNSGALNKALEANLVTEKEIRMGHQGNLRCSCGWGFLDEAL